MTDVVASLVGKRVQYTRDVFGGSYSRREVARRLLIMAIVAAIVIVPAIVALAMLMTGNAGR